MSFLEDLNLSSLIMTIFILLGAYVFYALIAHPLYLMLYYRLQGVPFVVSNPLEFTPHWLHERRREFSAKYHKFFMYVVGPFPFITLIDPELVTDYLKRKEGHFKKLDPGSHVLKRLGGNGLVTAEGSIWKTERRRLNKIFHHGNLVGMIDRMEQQCDHWINGIKGRIADNNGKPINLDFEMSIQELTMEALATCVMGGSETTVKSGGKEIQIGHLAAKGLKLAIQYILKPSSLLCPHKLKMNLDKETRKFNSTVDLMRQAASNVLTKRVEKLKQDPSLLETEVDLFDMMINGQCEDKPSVEEGLETLNLELLIDQIVTFFVAGTETTAIALTWLFYHLTTHPKVLEKLRSEVEAVFGDAFETNPESCITQERLNQLEYMQKVINENLRVVPPVPRTLARMAQSDVKIGDLHVKKGTIVSVEPYLIHHNESLWENPEEFNPDRKEWDQEDLDLRFVAFSAGKRNCIGKYFSMLETKILLVKLLLQLDVKCQLDAKERIRLGFSVGIDGGMQATIGTLKH